MRITRAGCLALALAVLGPTQPAGATSWGTLTAYRDGTARAQAYGEFYLSTSNGDRLAVAARYRARSDGYSAYVQVKWYYNANRCYPTGSGSMGCSTGWWGSGTSQTARRGADTYSSWVRLYDGVDWAGDSGRGVIRTCVDVQWQLDPCSPAAVRGVNYG